MIEVPSEMQSELTDVHGWRILAITLTSSSNVLDLGNYANGICFLHLHDGNQTFRFGLLKA